MSSLVCNSAYSVYATYTYVRTHHAPATDVFLFYIGTYITSDVRGINKIHMYIHGNLYWSYRSHCLVYTRAREKKNSLQYYCRRSTIVSCETGCPRYIAVTDCFPSTRNNTTLFFLDLCTQAHFNHFFLFLSTIRMQ